MQDLVFKRCGCDKSGSAKSITADWYVGSIMITEVNTEIVVQCHLDTYFPEPIVKVTFTFVSELMPGKNF